MEDSVGINKAKIEISKKAISQYGVNRVFKDFYWIK